MFRVETLNSSEEGAGTKVVDCWKQSRRVRNGRWCYGVNSRIVGFRRSGGGRKGPGHCVVNLGANSFDSER